MEQPPEWNETYRILSSVKETDPSWESLDCVLYARPNFILFCYCGLVFS